VIALLKAGLVIEKKNITFDLSHPFCHKHVVVTGSLHSMTRQEAIKKLKSIGAHVSDTVNKKTDFLIVGTDAGSKLDKAKKLNIPILTEAELVLNLS